MTREYISPEMILKPDSLDVRSDLFQVGLVAFEIMTGRRYWDVWPYAHADLFKADGWPAWLKWAVWRALAWDRDERYASPAKFRALLEWQTSALASEVLWQKGRYWRTATAIMAVALCVALWSVIQMRHKIAELEKTRQDNEELRIKLVSASTRISDQEDAIAALSEEVRVLRGTRPAVDLLWEIRSGYRALAEGRITQKACAELRQVCDTFLRVYEKHIDANRVLLFRDWLENALRAGGGSPYSQAVYKRWLQGRQDVCIRICCERER